MGPKWAVVCFLAAVLILSNGLNWMAGGTFTQEEFDILRAKVNAFNKGTAIAALAAAAKTISDELNTLWAPAWNVVFNVAGSNVDTVLYGYAFHNRWFWENGFVLTDGNFLTFIIWKDYNCVTWFTYNPIEASTFHVSSY